MMIRAGEATRNALLATGDRPILYRLRGDALTGTALAERVERLASALARRGLARARVALWYLNSFAAIEAFLAAERIGATRVPVDPGAAPLEARAVFEAARVDAVVADASHAQELTGDTLVHDDQAPLHEPTPLDAVDVPPDATLHLYPRMASKGALFAVPISYGNWDATMQINEGLFRSGRYGAGFGEDERFLTTQQIMHGTGLLATFPFILMGLPQVIIERFDVDLVLEACARYRPSTTFLVPGMLTRLAEAVGPSEHPTLRRILYGGAPIGVDEIAAAVQALGPVLVQVYGRLEGGWPIALLDVDDHVRLLGGDDTLATSCGRPIAEVEVKLRPVGTTGVDAGELCVRSPMVVAEYADPEGWCALGDLARMDDRGYLHLEGRLDGMINSGSYHIYPGEIEEVIRAVPGVLAVAVRGEPDPRWGQVVTAYLVPDPSEATRSLEAVVRTALAERLARYKIPKVFHIVGQLPV